MVQGFDIVQVDVAFLTYNALRDIANPTVKLDSSCVTGMQELEKHLEHKRRQKETMGPDAYKHYRWYNSMIRSELRAYGVKAKIRIIHWHIESGNARAFQVRKVFYKSTTVIIGPEREHWFCANPGSAAIAISGIRRRTTSQVDILKSEITLSRAIAAVKKVPVFDKEGKHCTEDFCANNCLTCQKYLSPFTSNKVCACYRTHEKTDDEDEDDDDDDEDEYVIFKRSNKNVITTNNNGKVELILNYNNQNLGTISEE